MSIKKVKPVARSAKQQGNIAIVFAVACMLSAATAPAATIFVAQDGDGTDGTSWPTAHQTIGEALAVTVGGEEIWVKAGVYDEQIALVTDNVSLYGGFSGSEAAPEQRDVLHQTSQVGRVQMTGPSRLDGFTVTGGSLNWGGGVAYNGAGGVIAHCRIENNFVTGLDSGGGGIFAEGTDLTVEHSKIIRNRSTFATSFDFLFNKARGGGIYSTVDQLTLTDCVIENNYALSTGTDAEGGGLYIPQGTATLIRCRIQGENRVITAQDRSIGALRTGGLWAASAGNVTLIDCVVSENLGVGINAGSVTMINSIVDGNGHDGLRVSGGMVDVRDSLFAINGNFGLWMNANTAGVVRSRFVDNQVGGVFSGNVRTTMSRCGIVGNGIAGDGNGVHFSNDFPGRLLDLVNCLIANNTATGHGGGIYQTGTEGLRIVSSTIAGNVAGATGGGVYGGAEIINSVLWDNQPEQIHLPEGQSADVTWSLVQGGFMGEGNVDADPLFVDAAAGDYRLLPDSPGIDSASSEGPATDILGRLRPVDIPGVGREGNDAFDMGAYELQLDELDTILTPIPTPTASETPTPSATATPDASETPFQTPHPGADINQDGVVDWRDLMILMEQWKHEVD